MQKDFVGTRVKECHQLVGTLCSRADSGTFVQPLLWNQAADINQFLARISLIGGLAIKASDFGMSADILQHFLVPDVDVDDQIAKARQYEICNRAAANNCLFPILRKIGGNDDVVVDSHRHRIARSEEHTSELQSLMRISYAVFCLKKKKIHLD